MVFNLAPLSAPCSLSLRSMVGPPRQSRHSASTDFSRSAHPSEPLQQLNTRNRRAHKETYQPDASSANCPASRIALPLGAEGCCAGAGAAVVVGVGLCGAGASKLLIFLTAAGVSRRVLLTVISLNSLRFRCGVLVASSVSML